MCGIAGLYYFDGSKVNTESIERMINTISHRGPDNKGVYIDGSLGLGHCRLSIIDLSAAGRQPMSNEDGSVWITYNGEVYNFKEIREQLEISGHIFRSNTDTEVIIHAYEEWGFDCLKHFNGIFAFALWDRQKKFLWLARDRLGVKPLFISYCQKYVIFGSEIKAVLSNYDFDRTLDYEALAYYLALSYMPAPHTLFSRIRQILPGHYLIIDAEGKVKDVEYWDIVYQEKYNRSKQSYLEEFTALFEDSVRLRLVSDVPFGVFLSGGIDSSSVAYWMSRHMSEPVKTFSIGFREHSFDELKYARRVAKTINSEHHEAVVTDDNIAEILPKLVWHSEEPTADSSMLAVYYVAQMARKYVKMVLIGDGADEIMAGYETYQAYYLQRLYRFLPAWLRRNVIGPAINLIPASDLKVSWDYKFKRFVAGAELSPEDAHASWRIIFNKENREKLLSQALHPSVAKTDVLGLYRKVFSRCNALHPLNRMLYVDTRFYLPNDMLVKIDRMTMSHGLEAREPYLDYRLVEFLASVPPQLKLKGFYQKKYLLKKSMEGKLPRSVIYRRKQGFNVPNARWIKKGLKPFVTDCLSPVRVREMGLFNEKTVQVILEDHFKEKADNSYQIWNLLVLSVWWQQFIAGSKA